MEGGPRHRDLKKKKRERINYQRVSLFFPLQETRMSLSSFILRVYIYIYILNYFLLFGFPPSRSPLFLPSQRRALYSSVGMVISLLSEAPSSRCTSSAPHWTRLSFSSSDVRSLRSSSHRHHGLSVNHGERQNDTYIIVCNYFSYHVIYIWFIIV